VRLIAEAPERASADALIAVARGVLEEA
jgi:hypothetical protein